MYSREIKEKRQKPIENGIPHQGTWTKAFKEIDLSDVNRPYSFPLLKGVKNLRIKEWESFAVQDDRYFLFVKLSNLKYYRTALIIIHNMETKEHYKYEKLIPGGGWRLPRSLQNDSVEGRSGEFFFRIHTWLDTKSIQLELDVKQTYKGPAFTAQATFNLKKLKTTPMVVNLLFSDRRNMYAYKALTTVRGDLVYGGQHIHFDPSKTSGIFCDCKGYYPFRKQSAWCSASGFDGNGKRFGFALGENQARESFQNNENALWDDGRLTPLPPVKMTQSGDEESDWTIQDMEGMVDLVFTPRTFGLNPVPDYEYSLGFFNGLVLNSAGEEIPVHNVWGIGERLYLKV